MYVCKYRQYTYLLRIVIIYTFQCARIQCLSAMMVELMVRSLNVSLLSSVVMVSLTVLEEKMNWITTVLVDLREQFV